MDAEFFLFSFIYLLKMGSEANSCISNKFTFHLVSQKLSEDSQTQVSVGLFCSGPL